MNIADQVAPRPIASSTTSFAGYVWSVDTDVIELADGQATRDVVRHKGAVAVMVEDAEQRIYLVRQYRHPVRRELWEPPAGLLDVANEDPLVAAKRELAEEADLTAANWHVLADLYTSPGGSSEAIRIYAASDVAPVAQADRHARTQEEGEMEGAWVNLDDVLGALAAGLACSPTLTVGAYALDAARRSGGATLRPADAPWLARDGVPR